MRRWRRLAALILLSALLCACGSRHELNDLAIVVAMGIDRAQDGRLSVTMAVAAPAGAQRGQGGGGGGRQPSKVLLQSAGRTLSEAIRNAELTSPRRLVLDHTEVVILGQRLVETGMDTTLDFLLRSVHTRLNTHLVILKGSRVQELMAAEPLMGTLQGHALRQLGERRSGLLVRLAEFFVAHAAPHRAALIPVVTMASRKGTDPSGPESQAQLAGAAILQTDRVDAYLDSQEVRGATWLRGDAREQVISVPCPGGTPDRFISGTVHESRRVIRPVLAGRRLSFEVRLTGGVRITDVQCPVDLSDLNQVQRVASAMNDDVRGRVEGVIRRSQAIPADPFRFGDRVRAMLPQFWRNVQHDWPHTWASVPVQVDARINIIHLEMTYQPPDMRD